MHHTTDRVILAAGLTPAWQQIVCLDALHVGEVNRARETRWCASGKVVNVGLALHYLGGPSKTLVPVGGAHGDAIRGDLAALGMTARWVPCQASTRVCTTIIDASATAITELVENAGPLETDEVERYVEAFAEEAAEAAYVVVTGSLPHGVAKGFCANLLRRTSAPAILDIRGQELLSALDTRPLLVKPNREELELTLGKKLPSDRTLIAAMREINALGAQWVLVTQGTAPAWLTSADSTFRCQPAKVQVVNSIGCGDSLAAGIAWALRNGSDMAGAVRYGLASAATNAESLLPGRFDASRVAARSHDITIEPIEDRTLI